MAINLIRNARVFLTTNVNAATGAYAGHATTTSANTFELQVQQGFSFNQATATQNITLNEAGPTPIRGQKAFNTALNPADFSFMTYMRPSVAAGLVDASEKVLWNAMLSNAVIPTAMAAAFTSAVTTTTTADGAIVITGTTFTVGLPAGTKINITGFPSAKADWNGTIVLTATSTATTLTGRYINRPTTVYAAPTAANIKFYTGPGWAAGFGVTGGGATSSCSLVNTAGTDVHQLQKFALIVVADTVTYVVSDCALEQATIDFGLDAISSVSWTGKGTDIVTTFVTPTLAALGTDVAAGNAAVPPLLGYKAPVLAANYIQNKLSTLTLISNIGGLTVGGTPGTSYTVALTGGSLTLQNNLNYKTPQNLGVVNVPIGYTTGTRAISGNITAYLRTGTAGDVGALLSAIKAGASTATDTQYRLQVEIGGATNGTRVEFEADGAMLSIPNIQTQDVVSTQINFVAQGTNQALATPGYDATVDNELTVRYFSI